MFAPLLVATAASLGTVDHLGAGDGDHRPIATRAPYPANMADDVRRPGFNGRLWVSRPILGSIQQGPYPAASGSPGAEAYGAYGQEDATVYARIGHLVVGISPWEQIDEQGLQRYEAARNFWLREQGFTGGVRTMINDARVWKAEDAPHAEHHAEAPASTPLPRATITLPAELPRQRRRFRVDAAPSLPGGGPARISWPAGAPADAVARTEARGGVIGGDAPSRVITQAR